MIVTRTPYRISFFGGGSDYPAYYKEHGGAVLGVTIDKYCWLAVRRPSPFGPRFRVVYSKAESCKWLDEVRHPAVRETLRYLGVDGIDLHHWSDLPARSGVGSSSAFVVGLIHALCQLTPTQKCPYELADTAIHIEQNILQETVGSQDQILTTFGDLNRISFPVEGQGKNGWEVECVHVPSPVLADLQSNLMLFYTGVQRTSSDVAATYVPQMVSLGKTKATLQKLVGMVDEGIKHLKAGDLDSFGCLLDWAWVCKKTLGEGISDRRIDAIYSGAKGAGALGGKLLGAGGGGFFLFYVPQKDQEKVRAALKGLTEVPFRFEDKGARVVYSGGVQKEGTCECA